MKIYSTIFPDTQNNHNEVLPAEIRSDLANETLFFHRNNFEDKVGAMVRLGIERDKQLSASAQKLFEAGVKHWVINTEEGRSAWEECCEDLNIGDLSHYVESTDLRNSFAAVGIQEFSVEILTLDDTISFDCSPSLKEGDS